MGVLVEIRDQLADESVSLPNVMRKAKILAARLKQKDFKEWVHNELNGYKDESGPVPDYRIVHTSSRGTAFGPFGSGMKNMPIPTSMLPEDLQDYATKVEVREGIGSVAEMAQREDLRFPWIQELVFIASKHVVSDPFQLVEAWRSCPLGAFARIVEVVRNRLLDFVLELEAVGADGDDKESRSKVDSAAVRQVFQTYIMGDSNVVSTGSGISQVATIHVVRKGDLKSLKGFLREIGIGDAEISELTKVLKKDEAPQKAGQHGPGVATWIGKQVTKAASGAWKFSVNTASAVLATAISRFYGFSG